jgi:ketosteroid isomerase-like protein
MLQQPWLAPVFCLGQSKRIDVNYIFMRKIFSIAVVVLSAAAIASGQQQGASRDPKTVVEQVIRKLDNERIQAQIHADAAALERIYADDFIGVGPSGTVRTKPQVISDFTSGDLRFQSITTDDVRVRVYGDAAVETGRSTMDGQDKGKAVPPDSRFTRVWVKQQGRWRLVANHYSSNTSHQ